MTLVSVRWWAIALVVPAAAVGAAWVLAHPQLPLGVTAVRAVADIAAVMCLGLAAVPLLDGPRYRDDLVRRAVPRLVIAGGVWLLAEVIRLAAVTAQAVAVPLTGLSVQTVSQFVVTTVAGRSAVFGIAAAAVLIVLAVAPRRGTPVWLAATITASAAGIAARVVTGHLADSAVGGLAVAVHALAAALWCGTLLALTLTVRARGQWARVLPAFSALALWCVAALLAGGIIAAIDTIGSPDRLLTDGYGRILLAKTAVTAVLMVLAWRNRRGWLVQARGHRLSADRSLARSVVELVLMAVALTLAAALSVTG